MKSANIGTTVSGIDILNISPYGIWILIRDKEYLMDFDNFPWFKQAPIGKILKVELHHSHHLHWPDLDIDQIENPAKYPLVDQSGPSGLPGTQ